MSDDAIALTPEEEECLKDRKWWCFLLSSIITAISGLALVLAWRCISWMCCRKSSGSEYSQSDQKKDQPGANPNDKKQEFEGTFMTDAKDWAGELISGQTTTGKMMVSVNTPKYDHF